MHTHHQLAHRHYAAAFCYHIQNEVRVPSIIKCSTVLKNAYVVVTNGNMFRYVVWSTSQVKTTIIFTLLTY